MILLDTTILVYSVGADHPLRGPCQDVVRRVADGALAATTTIEVIQEFTHVRARRRDRLDAVALAASFVTLLAPLVRPDDRDLRAGLELFADCDRLGMFDAVLAATVIGSSRLDGLMSADRAFGTVPGLRYQTPGLP